MTEKPPSDSKRCDRRFRPGRYREYRCVHEKGHAGWHLVRWRGGQWNQRYEMRFNDLGEMPPRDGVPPGYDPRSGISAYAAIREWEKAHPPVKVERPCSACGGTGKVIVEERA